MYKIIICDDEAKYLDQIKKIIDQYELNLNKPIFQTKLINNSLDLLDDLEKEGGADLYFLDIYIDKITGIQMAEKIRKLSNECSIVFLTSSKDHAIEAFKVNALHYIEKPIEEKMVFSAFNRFLKAIKDNLSQQYLVCKTSDGIVKIPFNDIIYIESIRQYQNIVMNDKEIKIRNSLSGLFETLKQNTEFIMPHRSFVVNMKYIKKLSTDFIEMNNNYIVPLPRGEFVNVKKSYVDYLFNYDKNFFEV